MRKHIIAGIVLVLICAILSACTINGIAFVDNSETVSVDPVISADETIHIGKYYTANELIEMTHEHQFIEIETKKPTCTKFGYIMSKCSCGEEILKNLDVLEHNYSLVETVNSTQNTNGYKLYSCTQCGNNYKNILPLLPTAMETDKCGTSLLEKALPHAMIYDVMTGILNLYHQHPAQYSNESLYIMPKDVHYIKVQQALIGPYRYIGGQLPYAANQDGNIRVWYIPELDAKVNIAYQKAYSVLKELGINNNMTQKEAITRINNWLCDNKNYDYAAIDDISRRDTSIYNSMMGRKGICENYAVAFQILCLAAGIECHYYGSSSMNHGWNKVYFSDGSYRWVDVTWNDSENNRTKYLLITDDQLLKDHSW